MAELNITNPTYSDWAKEMNPDGTPARTIKILNQKAQMLEDMVVIEGNLPTGHQMVIETSLPEPAFRLLNKGVSNSKGTTAQIVESCAILEDRSSVDKKIADLNGNTAAYRLNKAHRHVEGMTQKMQQTLFYGTAENPEEIVGLATRYSSLSAGNGDNIISGGGTGSDNLSIWLVGWGEHSVHGIFPKGSNVGLYHEDLGLQDEFDADNKRYRAYMDRWEWDLGIAIPDWRYVVRICNIDVSNLVNESSAADVIKLMSKSIDRIPDDAGVKLAFYSNRTVTSMLRIQALNKSSNAIEVQSALDQFGRPGRLSFLGIPVRRVDKLLNTEAKVS